VSTWAKKKLEDRKGIRFQANRKYPNIMGAIINNEEIILKTRYTNDLGIFRNHNGSN
jgi:hypothetical protein